ncbi:MAG TPA: hypothetical protein VF613_19555, partial [Longimicrobium sp.]
MVRMNTARLCALLALACAACGDSTGPGTGPGTGPDPDRVRFKLVDVGSYTSCGLTGDGVVYCWGKNGAGQLGRGDTVSSPRPRPLSGNLRFTQISVGDEHACGIASGGGTYCWGKNEHGQLGSGGTAPTLVPVRVAGAEVFDRVAAGGFNTCALRADGAAFCWGRNESGTLGTGTRGAESASPVAVAGGLRFQSLSVGGGHACGVTLENLAYCWGQGPTGATVRDIEANGSAPVPVQGGLSFSVVRAGEFMTCGLTTEGAAYCWGFDGSGGLGRGTTYDRGFGGEFPAPQKVASAQRYVSLSTGGQQSCAVTEQGAAFCWGWNMYGNLG